MSYSAKLAAVPVENAAMLAPIFEGLAKRSQGRVSVETIRRDLALGSWRAWAVWDGSNNVAAWVLTSIYEAPTGVKVFRVEGIVGRGRENWLHLIDELRDAARINGCSLFECHARRGWRDEIPWLKHTNNFLEARI